MLSILHADSCKFVSIRVPHFLIEAAQHDIAGAPQAMRSHGEYLQLAQTKSTYIDSVLQPPLPLQLFLPLHPLSPVLQPPWPLQAF